MPRTADIQTDPKDVADRIRSGDRRALARALTFVESRRADHRAWAEALLTEIMPDTGGAYRVGLSGVPGVGKSTLIEALGDHVTEAGHRIAVLAVDPSSKRSGGSILGDKTRMETLSRNPAAFIRPSPAGETLGGVARRTRESMLLCEAAGFDIILVETVGVGQSETAVAAMTDIFVLMLLPAGGDELQGMKKGIVELADLILVNKADGDLKDQARRTAADYHGALRLLGKPKHRSEVGVMACSAATRDGVAEIWSRAQSFMDEAKDAGALTQRRAEQAKSWLWEEASAALIDALRADDAVNGIVQDVEDAVTTGSLPASVGAKRLVDALLRR